jgi:hypothetical protein
MTRSIFGREIKSTFGLNTKPTEQEIDDFFSVIGFNDGFKNNFALQYHHQRKVYHQRWVSAMKSTKIRLLHINGPSDPIRF